jgi:hypothetical protein
MKIIIQAYHFLIRSLSVLGSAMRGQYKTSTPEIENIRKEMMGPSSSEDDYRNLRTDLRNVYGDVRLAMRNMN